MLDLDPNGTSAKLPIKLTKFVMRYGLYHVTLPLLWKAGHLKVFAWSNDGL